MAASLYAFVTGRVTAWVVLALAAGFTVLAFSIPAATTTAASSGTGLPESSQSSVVALAQQGLPSSQVAPAVVVYARGSGLTEADRAAIDGRVAALAPLALGGEVPPVEYAEDGTAALVVVPLAATDDALAEVDTVEAIREVAKTGLPAGLEARVTGPAAFSADLTTLFDGADVRLLLATVLVVAVLLIVTYRSPFLWVVPLVVVGVADRVAVSLVEAFAPRLGFVLDDAITGILSVLVFGAGTNYALLLIARYRDELREVEDRRDAMRRALTGAAPAILASGTTVALSLLTLLFADLTGTVALGFACALGVSVAVAFGLLVLPAALVIFGRGLFWPFVPRVGTRAARTTGWERLGRAVARRPVPVVLGSVLVLLVLATGALSVRTGLTLTEQFQSKPESVLGQEVLEQSFPAGSTEPVAIITVTSQAEAVAEAARSAEGVASVAVGESDGTVTQVDAVLVDAPGTDASYDAVRALRAAVAEVPGADAAVGGTVAIQLDTAEAAASDRRLVIPLVLIVVFGVLMLLLRALVAPVLLVATVVLSFFASLGLSWYLFDHVLGYPAIDTGVILLGFLFLVALGVDYNIFLVTRAREEAVRLPTREAMVRALSATGGVITSAGILLAAVFAVLGVLPIITLTQIGIIVGIGVLLDTLLVRTVLVPALAFTTGPRFWWPGRAAGDEASGRPAGAEPGEPAGEVRAIVDA